ncbi:O-antigen ligase family protein [Megalodesulfovibrio paquesii]
MASSPLEAVPVQGYATHASPRGQILNPIVAVAAIVVAVASMAMMVSPWYTYAWLPAFGLMLMLILGRKPELAFYVVLFFVPWDAVRSLAGPDSPITISKFAGAAMVLVVLLHMVFSKGTRYNLQSNLWRWIALFVVVGLVSALMTAYPDEAWDEFRKLLTSITIFALALALVDVRGFVRIVPRVVIISIGISTFMSVAAYGLGFNWFTMDTGIDRLVGVAKNPNHYASFVLFSMPLLAHWFFNATRVWVRLVGASIFTVNMIALMLTYSRGAFFVSLVVFGALLIEHGRKIRPKHFGFLGLGLAAAVLVLAVYVPDSYWERQKSISTGDTSIGARLSYVLFSWQSWQEHPLVGTGIGTFDRAYSFSEFAFTRGWKRLSRQDAQRDAHNTYLEVVVGMGTLGIIIFAGLLYLAWRNFDEAIQQSRKLQDPQFTQLIAAYRLSFLSLLAYFCLLSRLYSHYFWLCLALSTVALRIVQIRCREQQAQEARQEDHAPVVG